MLLVDAIRHLRREKMVIEWTNKSSSRGRLYRVHDPEADMPPVWLSAKAICSLADLDTLLTTVEKRKTEEDIHGVPI